MPVWSRRNSARRLQQADWSVFVSSRHHRFTLRFLQPWTLWLLPDVRVMSFLLLHSGQPEAKPQLGSQEHHPFPNYPRQHEWQLWASYSCPGKSIKTDARVHLVSSTYRPTGRWCSVPAERVKVRACQPQKCPCLLYFSCIYSKYKVHSLHWRKSWYEVGF